MFDTYSCYNIIGLLMFVRQRQDGLQNERVSTSPLFEPKSRMDVRASDVADTRPHPMEIPGDTDDAVVPGAAGSGMIESFVHDSPAIFFPCDGF